MAQYKCVPAPKNIVIDKDGNFDSAVRSFADAINQEAKDGWEFVSLEEIAVTKKSGCIAGLIAMLMGTNADVKIFFNMLVFVKK
ncbi:MAG: DUF4177 domain-containing protein [Candidatus Goldbacteria bacterium]|nr:DUF4177 domain-containing protein [Candidatus Goldiibacteriota bacterium]